MKSIAMRSVRFGARWLMAAAVLLVLGSVGASVARAVPHPCTAFDIAGGEGEFNTYAGAWMGELNGTEYAALLNGATFTPTSTAGGTFAATLTYSMLGVPGASAPVTGNYVVEGGGIYCQYELTFTSPAVVFEVVYSHEHQNISMLETDLIGQAEATLWATSTYFEEEVSCEDFPVDNYFTGSWQGTVGSSAYAALFNSYFGVPTEEEENMETGPYGGEVTYQIAGKVKLPVVITGTYTFDTATCTGSITSILPLGYTLDMYVIPYIYPPYYGWASDVVLVIETDGLGVTGVAMEREH